MTNNFREKANFIWQVADDILREAFRTHEYGDVILPFVVHTKLDLYKKLTEPKVNEMLERQWFEVLASGMSDQDGIQGR